MYINNKNTELIRIEKSVSSSLNNTELEGSTTDLKQKGTYINPPIPFTTCEYIYKSSPYIFSSTHILADDILFGDIQVYDDKDDEVSSITRILNKSKDELKNLIIDYNFAGCAILEFGFTATEFYIQQLPISTCKYLRTAEGILVEQDINSEKKYFKISGEEYPVDFTHYNKQKLGYVHIFSGDNIYSLFSIPKWYPLQKKILTAIGIDTNNYNLTANGNIANSLLLIGMEKEFQVDPTQNTTDERARAIKNELEDGEGVAVVFAESEKPITSDYIEFTGKTNSEEQTLLESCEDSICNIYQIPKIRYLDNSETESMNSHKSEVIWDIYNLNLENQQNDFFKFIQEFLHELYSVDYTIKCNLPKFVNDLSLTIDNVTKLYDSGIITKGEAIKKIGDESDIIELDDYDLESPSLNTYKTSETVGGWL